MTDPPGILRCRHVAAPRERVWDALAAFDEIVHWAPDVEHSARTTVATTGVGAARRVQVGGTALIETVIEWVPPEALGYTIQGLPPVSGAVTTRWSLSDAGGGTDVALTTTIEPASGPKGRVGAGVSGRLLARAGDRMLEGLAAWVEDDGEAGPAAARGLERPGDVVATSGKRSGT